MLGQRGSCGSDGLIGFVGLLIVARWVFLLMPSGCWWWVKWEGAAVCSVEVSWSFMLYLTNCAIAIVVLVYIPQLCRPLGDNER
jgi:hypothetical protein